MMPVRTLSPTVARVTFAVAGTFVLGVVASVLTMHRLGPHPDRPLAGAPWSVLTLTLLGLNNLRAAIWFGRGGVHAVVGLVAGVLVLVSAVLWMRAAFGA